MTTQTERRRHTTDGAGAIALYGVSTVALTFNASHREKIAQGYEGERDAYMQRAREAAAKRDTAPDIDHRDFFANEVMWYARLARQCNRVAMLQRYCIRNAVYTVYWDVDVKDPNHHDGRVLITA